MDLPQLVNTPMLVPDKRRELMEKLFSMLEGVHPEDLKGILEELQALNNERIGTLINQSEGLTSALKNLLSKK